jgi:hypothetical protein
MKNMNGRMMQRPLLISSLLTYAERPCRVWRIHAEGEWSVDLENIAMTHSAVAMAACIAANHPRSEMSARCSSS